MVACLLLILFNGVGAFLEKPFGIRTFISSYISVSNLGRAHSTYTLIADDNGDTHQLPVFILLVIGYKIRHHGFRLSEWGFERSEDLGNVMQVHNETRKGRLEFVDHSLSKDNWAIFARWLWDWMK